MRPVNKLPPSGIVQLVERWTSNPEMQVRFLPHCDPWKRLAVLGGIPNTLMQDAPKFMLGCGQYAQGHSFTHKTRRNKPMGNDSTPTGDIRPEDRRNLDYVAPQEETEKEPMPQCGAPEHVIPPIPGASPWSVKGSDGILTVSIPVADIAHFKCLETPDGKKRISIVISGPAGLGCCEQPGLFDDGGADEPSIVFDEFNEKYPWAILMPGHKTPYLRFSKRSVADHFIAGWHEGRGYRNRAAARQAQETKGA